MGKPFDPKEVIFAPTATCNLACGHCRVNRNRGKGARWLTTEAAVNFLRDCAAHGIERVGFSGGEPFLEPDFLAAVCADAVDLGLEFDRLMTNGTWFKGEEDLRDTLETLYDSGFDGKIGLSLDDWHGQEPERVALFIDVANDVSGRNDAVEIDSALSRDGLWPAELLEATVAALNARIEAERDGSRLARFRGVRLLREDGVPRALEDAIYRENAAAGMDDGGGLRIPITGIPYSRGINDADAWKSPEWFRDDFCEGPGNVLYVHPDGIVAACCGFANERPELALGSVEDGVEALVAAGRSRPYVRACYETGLGEYRKELEAKGIEFPGKTDDMCFFCDWVCGKGLSAMDSIEKQNSSSPQTELI